MSIRFVLFDLDGTVIDSEKAAIQAILEAFRGWKTAFEPEDAALIAGRKWEVAFDHIFKKYNVPEARPEAENRIKSLYRRELERNLQIVPGSAAAIRALSEEYPLALVSGSDREQILWALKKTGVLQCFRHILGAEDYPESKPSPAGYLRAIELLGEKAEHGLVFEDSEAGVAAARAAGTRVVAVTSTNHFEMNLEQAHYHITDFTGVDARWVRNLKF